MPKQKDLKRLIRARMQKTGEAFTAARVQILKKNQNPKNQILQSEILKKEPAPKLAAVAGMSDAAVRKATGRTWAEWVDLLDAERSSEKPHREIVGYVVSLGTPGWWAQMVTVGYERIRGLRDRGQRRGGAYEATKSRTFPVSVDVLFAAFANARKRRQWLPAKITARSATPPKYLRWTWEDGMPVQLGFIAKGKAKSSVAVTHEKLADKPAVDAAKKAWSERFDRLEEILG